MALSSIFVMLCFVTLRLSWCAGTAWHSGRTTKRTQTWATFYLSGTTPTFPRSTTTSMSRPSLNSRKQQVRTRSPAAESLKHRRDFNFSSFQVRSQKIICWRRYFHLRPFWAFKSSTQLYAEQQSGVRRFYPGGDLMDFPVHLPSGAEDSLVAQWRPVTDRTSLSTQLSGIHTMNHCISVTSLLLQEMILVSLA